MNRLLRFATTVAVTGAPVHRTALHSAAGTLPARHCAVCATIPFLGIGSRTARVYFPGRGRHRRGAQTKG